MNTKSFIYGAVILFLVSPLARADDPAAAATNETRLRQALRDTMQQLRDAQNQLVAAQAQQTQSDKDKADLQAKLDSTNTQLKTVTDEAALEKTTASKALEDLRQGNEILVVQMVDVMTAQINTLSQPDTEKHPDLAKEIDALKTQNPTLAKPLEQYGTDIQLWTNGYIQYAQFATKTEAERAKLAGQVAELKNVLADREVKNLALYKLGSEILTRYEKFGLGDAISAKEPFVGVSRVKLENLVQDYKNKLLDQTIAATEQLPAAPAPATKVANSVPATKAE